jgi:putative ABC transport system permease protein
MLINYLKVAVRSIMRNKLLSFINIAGLAIGLTAGILIYMWVQDELSYDRFHKHADDIYRVVETQFYTGEPFYVAVTPGPLAAKLKSDYPEIVNAVRMNANGREIFRYGDNTFIEKRILFADKEFFEVFSFPFIKGIPERALSDPNSIVLTESAAAKYFHDEDPIGKNLVVSDQLSFQVTGIIEDIPHNSHLQFDSVVPFETLRTVYGTGRNMDDWATNSYHTYIKLQKGYPYRSLEEKIIDLQKTISPQSSMEYHLQPMTDIHLYSGNRYAADVAGNGDILYVKLCSLIAIIIVLIACINYMNLATARSGNRAREIGMRKVVGARKGAIVRQFMGEALIYALIAFAVSLVLVELLLPIFNNLSQKELSLDVQTNIGLYGQMFLLALITGIISGSYPALYLSAFRPASVLKGTLVSGKRGAFVRKCLVVLQFSLSVILIIGTMVVHYQLQYVHNKKLGLDKENLVYVNLRREAITRYDALKSRFLEMSSVAAVTRTTELPLNLVSSSGGFSWAGKDPLDDVLFHRAGVDAGYADVFKMEVAEGRFFSEGFFGDSNAVVVNEEAARIMGEGESVVGKTLTMAGQQRPIIGVLKDFHFKPLQTKIEPLVMYLEPGGIMVVRVNPGNMKTTLAALEESYSEIVPEIPFEYGFVDEDYDNMYRVIERMGDLFNYMSALAIFVSCLGLFGLASYITEKRTKEIGIRKAYSASVTDIVFLLSRQFLKWVLIANVIAWPIAYIAAKRWLQTFAYRTDIGVEIFVLTTLGAFAISIVTISWQTIKAARGNPVDSLRYE